MQATFFLGSCTPRGFSTFASELAEECGAVDYIKGGSGCGKSTFLRRIADEAAARGLEVWRFLCSSDPQSLDAVVLPSLGRGWVDATAPHVLEPTLCAGREGYVDFGAFYDRAGIARVEPELRRRKRENAAQYPLVTACLAAADRLLDDNFVNQCKKAEETNNEKPHTPVTSIDKLSYIWNDVFQNEQKTHKTNSGI